VPNLREAVKIIRILAQLFGKCERETASECLIISIKIDGTMAPSMGTIMMWILG